MNAEANNRDYKPEQFCSTRDAARILGISHRTVQLWVESGVLQAWKTAGGHRRITMNSVEKLVRDRELAGAAPVQLSNLPSLPAAVKQVARARVMVVDDDEATLILFEMEMAGWDLPLDVVKARNGFEALIRIGEVKPDLLISDLNMPGMDGARMIATLRADRMYRDIKLVVVTGLDAAGIRDMDLPPDVPVFSKPVDFGRLRKTVETVVSALAQSPLASPAAS